MYIRVPISSNIIPPFPLGLHRLRAPGNTFSIPKPKTLTVGSDTRIPSIQRRKINSEHGFNTRTTISTHDGVVLGAGVWGPAAGRCGGGRGSDGAGVCACGCGDTVGVAEREGFAV